VTFFGGGVGRIARRQVRQWSCAGERNCFPFGALIGVLGKTRARPTVTRNASEWSASLSLALRVTLRNTPIKVPFGLAATTDQLPQIGVRGYVTYTRRSPDEPLTTSTQTADRRSPSRISRVSDEIGRPSVGIGAGAGDPRTTDTRAQQSAQRRPAHTRVRHLTCSIRSRATSDQRLVSASTSITFTCRPAARFSRLQHRCAKSIRYIVAHMQTTGDRK
jgi:hypothetical protein